MAQSKIQEKVKITTKVEKTKVENTVVKSKPVTVKKPSKLTVDVLDIKGKVSGTIELPAEIFDAKVNTQLMAQAVRVYLANQRSGSASTKTRSEVIGSTRKIYKQKGTGRARHGAAKAPIFVHGGVAHGPKPTDHSLSMSKSMRQKALFAALTSKLQAGEIKIVSGFDKIDAKTKVMVGVLKSVLADKPVKKVLLVLDTDGENKNQNIIRSGRNLQGIKYTSSDRLNAYEVINTRQIIMLESSIARMETHFLRKATS